MKHFLSQHNQIEDRLQTLRSVLTFCFGIGYIANVFLAQPLLALINTIMLVLAVILSFIATKGSTRMIAAVLLFVGAFLLIYAQAPLNVWEKALLENGYLLAMFIMVPLISLPVRYGGYNESLEALFERFGNSESRFYGLVSVMTAFLGVLVSIASVPLTCEVARSSRFAGNTRVLATALSRGFITCLFLGAHHRHHRALAAAYGRRLALSAAIWPTLRDRGWLHRLGHDNPSRAFHHRALPRAGFFK